MSENDRDGDEMAGLERRAREKLGRLVAATSPEIRARLQAMATRAAHAPTLPARRNPRYVAWPLGACALAASAVVAVLWWPAKSPIEPPSAADDLALLLNVDNLDLLEQMEFYQWLDRDPALLESGATPGAQRS